MWLDLAALAILVGAMGVGFLRGWLVSSIRFGGAGSAYVGAWWLGPQVAPLFEARGLSGMLAVAAGGLAVFFVLLVSVEILAAVVKAIETRRRGGQARTAPDRFGGALVGAIPGAGFAVPEGDANGRSLTVHLRDGSLDLLQSTDGFVDLLSPATLTGSFTATHNDRRARQLSAAVRRLVNDALGSNRRADTRTPIDRRIARLTEE